MYVRIYVATYTINFYAILYCISGVTVLNHKRSAVHSIFQISISCDTKCARVVGFPRDCHIFFL